MGEAERLLLSGVARAVLSGERGSLAHQLDRPDPPLAEIRARSRRARTARPARGVRAGRAAGGAAARARERDRRLRRRRAGVRHRPRRATRRRRCPGRTSSRARRFGTVVTASGSSFTWSENSRENRLTPFANDPVADPTSEAILVRDDDSGEAWSPTPGPLPRDGTSGRFVIRHGAGVTRFARDRERHPPRARRLRGRVGPGEALAPDADQRERRPAAPLRLRLRRVGPRTAAGGPEPARRDGAGRGDRRDPRHERLEPRVRRARRLRPRERAAPLGDRRPHLVPRPERLARAPRGARARALSGQLRRGARSLRGAPGRRRTSRRASRGGSSSSSARGGTSAHVRELVARHGARRRRGRRARGRAARVGRHPRRGAGPHARRLLRRAHEPVAALPGPELPDVGPHRLPPARRRLRVPRPAPGRDGARAGAPRARARAPPARGGPAVPRGRRPALVAPAERPRDAHPLLGRPRSGCPYAVAHYVRTTGDAGVLDERVPFLDGAAARAGRAGRSTRSPAPRRRRARSSSTACAPSTAGSPRARTACRSWGAATGTTG